VTQRYNFKFKPVQCPSCSDFEQVEIQPDSFGFWQCPNDFCGESGYLSFGDVVEPVALDYMPQECPFCGCGNEYLSLYSGVWDCNGCGATGTWSGTPEQNAQTDFDNEMESRRVLA